MLVVRLVHDGVDGSFVEMLKERPTPHLGDPSSNIQVTSEPHRGFLKRPVHGSLLCWGSVKSNIGPHTLVSTGPGVAGLLSSKRCLWPEEPIRRLPLTRTFNFSPNHGACVSRVISPVICAKQYGPWGGGSVVVVAE